MKTNLKKAELTLRKAIRARDRAAKIYNSKADRPRLQTRDDELYRRFQQREAVVGRAMTEYDAAKTVAAHVDELTLTARQFIEINNLESKNIDRARERIAAARSRAEHSQPTGKLRPAKQSDLIENGLIWHKKMESTQKGVTWKGRYYWRIILDVGRLHYTDDEGCCYDIANAFVET